MDSSDSDRYSVSESGAPPTATRIQGQPPPLREQSETQIPFVSNTELHDTIPDSPDLVSNEPALWQLGRHSYYLSSTGYDQQSTGLAGQPVLEGDGQGPGHAQHQVSKLDEAGLRDVEEELHRGLQARQVRVQLILGACWLLDDYHRFQ